MDKRCGTYAGAKVHARRKEPLCDSCKVAYLNYHSAYRAKNIEAKTRWTRLNYLLNGELLRGKSRANRARKSGVVVEFYTEMQVVNLYGAVCHICKKEIDLNASRREGGNGLHIDHIIPTSKGGGDILKNVRPAHRICNQKKGNR